MYCLKCGKEAEDNRVFCAHCLEVMEDYPVKPGTHIQLPHREPVSAKKAQRRHRSATPEEQVFHLRRLARILSFCLAVVSVLLCITATLLFLPPQEEAPDDTGRNYTVDTED